MQTAACTGAIVVDALLHLQGHAEMTECVDCAFCAPLTDADRDQIFQALLEIVGPRGLVTAPDEIAAASLDSRRRRQGSAL